MACRNAVFFQQLRDGCANGQHGRLRVLGLRQNLLRPFKYCLGQILLQNGIGLGKHGFGHRIRIVESCPIPTYCAPVRGTKRGAQIYTSHFVWAAASTGFGSGNHILKNLCHRQHFFTSPATSTGHDAAVFHIAIHHGSRRRPAPSASSSSVDAPCFSRSI